MKTALAFLLGCCLLLVAVPSFAVGSYRFCAEWQYKFSDANVGEDHLKNYQVGTYGAISARYTWANVHKDGQLIWSGYMDSNGCTPTVPAISGDYSFKITSAVARNGRYYWTQRTDTSGWTYYQWQGRKLGLSSGTETVSKYFGAGAPIVNVAAAMVHVASTDNGSVEPGTYTIYAELACGEYGACFTGSAIMLGNDAGGLPLAQRKAVILHEFGHFQQDRYMGSILGNYSQPAPPQAACKCDHVQPEGHRLHCLQSREYISAAQQEAYAHLYAARTINDGAEIDMIFPYYKEFRLDDGTIMHPPVVVSVAAAPGGPYFRWMEGHCLQSNSGTELDWLVFYYQTHRWTPSPFSMSDLRSLYRQACNIGGAAGNCANDNVLWNHTEQAVTTVWGYGSPKHNDWVYYGTQHGIRY